MNEFIVSVSNLEIYMNAASSKLLDIHRSFSLFLWQIFCTWEAWNCYIL